jgi:hypothetical protein
MKPRLGRAAFAGSQVAHRRCAPRVRRRLQGRTEALEALAVEMYARGLSSALDRALRAEGLRNARLFNLYRFVGISAFFIHSVVMSEIVEAPGWKVNLPFFAVWWSIAAVSWQWGRRSDRVARAEDYHSPTLPTPPGCA